MRKGFLSQYFIGSAIKTLTAVEANSLVSNQHEFNATSKMIEFFGRDNRKFPATLLYLTDAEDETIAAKSELTWYDARRKQAHRAAEYRLYFRTTPVSDAMHEEDSIVVALRPNGEVLVVVARQGSTSANQLAWLFGTAGKSFNAKDYSTRDDTHLSFAGEQIVEAMGVLEIEQHIVPLEEILQLFGGGYPPGRTFSEYARSIVPADAVADPDGALETWYRKEAALFQALERHLVDEWIKSGIADAESFIEFARSVLNRRMSRAGNALEYHLEQIFRDNGLRFSMREITEGKSRPDFVFPHIDQYRNPDYSEKLLKMLAVKHSCKDRWRQILVEAGRVDRKHLFTLEPAISADQTTEMRTHGVQLVLPQGIHGTYQPAQQAWLLNLAEFIEIISKDQKDLPPLAEPGRKVPRRRKA